MKDLSILQPCRTSFPYTTLGRRVASWGKTSWGEEAGGLRVLDGVLERRRRDGVHGGRPCPRLLPTALQRAGGSVDHPTWDVTQYWRPAGPWDEALVIGQEDRLANGRPDPELPYGSQYPFARRGNKVTVVWGTAWYVPGISNGADEYFYQEHRERAQELLTSLG